jgi:flagellum-specific ATP synthase
VRAVDGLLPVGKGQRLGVFAGSGVGKTTFQGMIARNTRADVNVIALIGERGRELNDFIQKSLGEEGMARSVVVVSTSDQSAIAKIRGAYMATTIAEYFRDQGKDVMLLFDSVMRFAEAQREVGQATGEAPGQRAYTASVWDNMKRLLERAGRAGRGSITGFYTVLVEGGDMDEPVSDNARAILDGHIAFNRALAGRGHYPAIDVLGSVSRCDMDVTTAEERKAMLALRRLMAVYAENEAPINFGIYKQGSNKEIDAAIAAHDKIESFLMQDVTDKAPLEETLQKMGEIAGLEIAPDNK